MAIELGSIQFGEIDAKHELFSQEREGSYILLNSFQMPPSVNFDRLLSGSKFFIYGLKGSGKTSLLLYLRHQIELAGSETHTVLFKSKLTEPERQRIAKIHDLTAFIGQNDIRYEQDYKINWLWFIISEISRLISSEDVLSGKDHLHDLKLLTGTQNSSLRSSVLSGLQLTKVKATLDAALKAGPFKTGIKTEIEALPKNESHAFMDVVEACERLLYNIELLPGKKKALFFDELELFVGKLDQKDRDIFLIRDLLYSVSRINQGFGSSKKSICVYASVRSEVLFEINRVSPEIERDVKDFGVSIDWHGKSTSADQGILSIIEAKINQSEIEAGFTQTDDVWDTYFSHRLSDKTTKQYLLDISMFKPRTLVMLLKSIASNFPAEIKISTTHIDETEPTFSAEVWREVEEELRTSYDATDTAAIKKALKGLPINVDRSVFSDRIRSSCQKHDDVRKILGTKSKEDTLLETLYRIGAVGTRFETNFGGRRQVRDAWVFRHAYEPQFDGTISFHASLRKALQLVAGGRPTVETAVTTSEVQTSKALAPHLNASTTTPSVSSCGSTSGSAFPGR